MLSLYLRPNGWFTAFNLSRLQILRSFWLDYTINIYSVLLSFLASHYQLHIGRNWGIFPMNCSYKWNKEIIVKSELLRNSSNNIKMFIFLTFKLILNHTSRVSVEHIQIDDPKHKSTMEIYFHPRKNWKKKGKSSSNTGKIFRFKMHTVLQDWTGYYAVYFRFPFKTQDTGNQQHETKEPVLHPVFMNNKRIFHLSLHVCLLKLLLLDLPLPLK